MKVGAIQIQLMLSSGEMKESKLLVRSEDKVWTTDGKGLHPNEIELAQLIQQAIASWRG